MAFKKVNLVLQYSQEKDFEEQLLWLPVHPMGRVMDSYHRVPKAAFKASSPAIAPPSNNHPTDKLARQTIMHLRARSIVLASLCLLLKLGCIALLRLQALSSQLLYDTSLFAKKKKIHCFTQRRSYFRLAYVGSDRPRT